MDRCEQDMRVAGSVAVTLALLDCGAAHADIALSHLASDLGEALDVYERMAARHIGRTRVRRFDLTCIDIDARAWNASPCDADEVPYAADALEHGGRDAIVYAIACTDERSPARAQEGLARTARLCASSGRIWGGGLALAEGRLIAPCVHGPRMGRMRRSRSEGIDLLIAAIRSQCPVASLPDSPASGIITPRAPIPGPLYPLAADLYERLRS